MRLSLFAILLGGCVPFGVATNDGSAPPDLAQVADLNAAPDARSRSDMVAPVDLNPAPTDLSPTCGQFGQVCCAGGVCTASGAHCVLGNSLADSQCLYSPCSDRGQPCGSQPCCTNPMPSPRCDGTTKYCY